MDGTGTLEDELQLAPIRVLVSVVLACSFGLHGSVDRILGV